MNKLLVICGPTATGKTSLALKIAKKLGGELVSADSRQVYRGMDVGTGKDLPVNFKFQITNYKLGRKKAGYYADGKTRIWLLDVVEPDQDFNVAQYTNLAWRIIKDIWKRDKLPILVGGTGFYIKSVVDGLETLGVPQNPPLRAYLEQKAEEKGVEALYDELSRLDPEKAAVMNRSDRKNPRRLIRAIEVARWEMEISGWQKAKKGQPEFDLLMIGLTTPTDELYARIDARVEERIRRGSEEEVRRLLEKGYSWELPAMSAMGYREWRAFIEGKAGLEDVKKLWQNHEHGYARRQLTWFKKDKRIKWFDVGRSDFEKQVEKEVGEWYSNGKTKKLKNLIT